MEHMGHILSVQGISLLDNEHVDKVDILPLVYDTWNNPIQPVVAWE
jgi:hypothetical protein